MLLAIAKQFLLCSVIMGAVSAVVLLALPRLSRHASARSLFGALLAVVLAFIVPLRPPVPAFFTRQAQEAWTPAPVAAETLSSVTTETASASVSGTTILLPMPLAIVELPTPGEKAPPVTRHLPAVLSIVWLAGAVAVWLLHSLRHRRFMRTVSRWAEPVTDPETLALFQQEKRALGIRRRIALVRCPFLTTPMLAGFLRPTVLLPEMAIAPEALRLILRHELVHYRRGDLPAKALALLAQAVHWYNPAIYLVANALSQQGELACDAAVVRGADDTVRRQYGTAILSIVRGQSGLRTALSTTFTGGKESMKQRIVSLLDVRTKRLGTLALCAVLVLITLTGAALAIDSAPLTDPSEAAIVWEQVFASFAPYGLLYDAATETLTFNGQRVRMFDDVGTYVSPSGGEIDTYASYDGQGNLIGIGIYSDAEFAARGSDWMVYTQTTQTTGTQSDARLQDTRSALEAYLHAWQRKDYDTMASLTLPIDGETNAERVQRLYWAHNWWDLQGWSFREPLATDNMISYTVETTVMRNSSDAETMYLEYQPVFYQVDGEWLLDAQTFTTGIRLESADVGSMAAPAVTYQVEPAMATEASWTSVTEAYPPAAGVTIVADTISAQAAPTISHHIEPVQGTHPSTQSFIISRDTGAATASTVTYDAAPVLEAYPATQDITITYGVAGEAAPVTEAYSSSQSFSISSEAGANAPGQVVIQSGSGTGGSSGTVTAVESVSTTRSSGQHTTVRHSASGSTTTATGSMDLYADYAPYGLTYDAATDTLVYNGQSVRYFVDITWADQEALASGFFHGGVTTHHSAHGEIDLRAVRDDNDALIGLEIFHHDSNGFSTEWFVEHAR